MRISVFLLAGLLLVVINEVHAQTKATAQIDAPKAALLKDGVFRQNGLTMRLLAGQISRLSAPLTLENGAVVRSNGIIVGLNGSHELLPENHAITMQGSIVLLRDDMFTPGTIALRSQTVTGSSGETRFTVPKSAATANGTDVSPRLTAKLLRTEQRLAMLEEMTTYLERRAHIKSAAMLAIDQQLSQVNAQLQKAKVAPSVLVDSPAAKVNH